MPSDKSKNLEQRDELLNLIVGGDLDGGVSGLADYFALGTPEGLISMLIDAGEGADPKPSDFSAADQTELASAAADALGSGKIPKFVKRVILDTVKGAYLTRDLVDTLEQFGSGEGGYSLPLTADNELFKVLSIHGGPDQASKLGIASINSVLRLKSDSKINGGEPSKSTPGLSAYIVKPVGISPGTKNTGALSLFMNAIPTIEFNRAVPFVELTLQVGRAPVSVDGRLNSPSLLKFVLGASNVDEASADFSMATSARATLEGNEVTAEEATAVAGMELFLAPQTMTSIPGPGELGFAGTNSPSTRVTPILDPFRPLAAIERVNIDVAASQGFMSFKTATVELVCYDRSRLHEIADFVKPDLYSKTEFLMEYGWHHPDGFEYDRSPFGALLNAMRVKEKYGIINSSFQFEDNGTIRITLQLAMKGANEYRTVQVGSDEDTQDALKDISDLQDRVAEIRNAINNTTLAGKRHGKSIFSEQLLNSAQTTVGNPTLDKKQRTRLSSIIKSLDAVGKSNEKAKELADTLKELYIESPDGDKGAVERFANSIKKSIDEKFKKINGFSPTQIDRQDHIKAFPDITNPVDVVIDPFINKDRLTQEDLNANQGRTSKWVSFGKVFMTFVAEPIAATGRFDDVQVLFYPMNNGAGHARNTSVASFLIRRDDLRREFETFVIDRRADNITVGEFQNFVNQTFIDNVANPSYGMATNYKPEPDRDGEVRIVANLKGPKGRGKKERMAQWATDLEQKLLHMGVPNGVFRPPQVDLHIETLPARVPMGSEGQARDFQDEKTILRIHVFDKAATMYDTQGELIRATTDSYLNTVGLTEVPEDKDEGGQLEAVKKILAAAVKAKVVEEIPSNEAAGDDPKGPVQTHYRVIVGPQEIKSFVMSTAPYVIYGASNTAIETFAMQSIQDPALATVNMIRSDRAGSITPEGSGKGGVPLKTIPATVELTSMGCPLLTFMQQFFVDAQTGTDLDNIYAITGLNHTIESTSFKSAFEMVPQMAYGKYESGLTKIEQAIGELETLVKNSGAPTNA